MSPNMFVDCWLARKLSTKVSFWGTAAVFLVILCIITGLEFGNNDANLKSVLYGLLGKI